MSVNNHIDPYITFTISMRCHYCNSSERIGACSSILTTMTVKEILDIFKYNFSTKTSKQCIRCGKCVCNECAKVKFHDNSTCIDNTWCK